MSTVFSDQIIQTQKVDETKNREKLHVRPAQVEDAENLGNLWLLQRDYHRQWDELYESLPSARYDWVDQLISWLEQKNHCVLVAEDEQGEIIGYVHGSFYPWPMSPFEYYGSLNTISVAEELRGRGVGKKLVNSLLDWFRENQIQQISLHVDYRNERAIQLYSKIGFRPYQHRLMLNASAERFQY